MVHCTPEHHMGELTPRVETETLFHLCFYSKSDEFLPLDFTKVLISKTDEAIYLDVIRILPLWFLLSPLDLLKNQGKLCLR